MGFLEVSGLEYWLADGRMLFHDASFRVGDGDKVALIGANGMGKTTLLRLITGELKPESGTVRVVGGLGVMPQFIGSVRDSTTVHEFLVSLARPELRHAFSAMERAELAMMESDSEAVQLRYAEALSAWGDAGGYDAEVEWDLVTQAALRLPFEQARFRELRTLSGGEQKRLALEALFRGSAQVLLLDEPDNYLDVPGKRQLEETMAASQKTVLYVSHDRELLAATATRVLTLEAGGVWVHGGGFRDYHEAREARLERLDELHRRWSEEHQRLKDLVRTLQQQAKASASMAGKYRATQTRLARFEEAGPPPERPVEQNVRMRLRGDRTAVRAVRCEGLELKGLTRPFDLEVYFGERVAVLGANGTGKSHLLRLLAAGGSDQELHDPDRHGEPVAHAGTARLGGRVRPGWFAQTQQRPDLTGRTLVEILGRGDGDRDGRERGAAVSALRRYELQTQADQTFESLSGGQQARFQILLLELQGATLLLLDEPTDNLDLHSAEALEAALERFEGTVLAVTHDRWFARTFDRFVVLDDDGEVREHDGPYWGPGIPA
ncbi:ATPase subunit of ABC transporter with duplicated ATPase domains [Streptomyces sp. PanSC19]|uniref:ABC-F family ATP-binding cassette domain-containing protein n=1 Tax=Streptomyces litmocidini TaxID=67318 RepID=A0ABW7UD59_9ACTN|nr:ATP-binding cassette domain-containing protein [Streptomyces sp. PanSC19]ROQ26165.1 ATPase subunit of ABC transporter with duplicated ATPase domains [Streptomyces sp. PanSC19]